MVGIRVFGPAIFVAQAGVSIELQALDPIGHFEFGLLGRLGRRAGSLG